MSRAARRVGGRVAAASGLEDLDALEERVDSLTVAVAENAALAVPLADLVGSLEHDVADVLAAVAARRLADGMGS